MSSLFLKILAIVLMTIDHIGSIFFNNNEIFRFVGRASFPLFAFLLVEGFNHTKNDSKKFFKYSIRILLFAIISEPIYDKLFFNNYIYVLNQNILFTLFVGLLLLYLYEKNSSTLFSKIIYIFIIIYISLLTCFMFLDYNFLGIFLIFGLYFISKKDSKKIYYLLLLTVYIILNILIYGFSIKIFGVLLSLIPIYLYNNKKGYKSKIIQYLFYIYYPLHLLILLLVKTIM